MPLTAHGVTHPGRRRTNEDALVVDPAAGLFIVADGMGGHNAGEVASAIAVRSIHEFVAKGEARTERMVSEALCLANENVLHAAASEPHYAGMGTTVVAAYVADADVLYGNVGDSRIYLWRDGALMQLTRDDSWVSRVLEADALPAADVQRHPMRHVLTKVIGLREDLEPAVGVSSFLPGDVLLLCSDGLHGAISDGEIAQVLRTGTRVEEIAEQLVERALTGGGTDNITVVIVRKE